MKTPEIYSQLLKFQTLVKPIGKDATNPFYKSKYCTLDNIQEAIKQPLIECGLVVEQGIIESGLLKTKVVHAESGTFVECFFPIVVQKPDAQNYGSAMSYAKRYSLSGILNLTIGGEDDDGHIATKVEVATVKPVAVLKKEIIDAVSNAEEPEALTALYNKHQELHTNKEFINMLSAKKSKLLIPSK